MKYFAENKFLNYLKSDKRLLLALLMDLYIINGVLFYDWSTSRMLAFYYLEVCSMIITYAVYNIIIKQIYDGATALFSALFICAAIGLLFAELVNWTGEFEIYNMRHPATIFYPYYDLAVYLVGLTISQYYNLRKYLMFNKETGKAVFSINLLNNLVFLPALLFMALILSKFNPNMKVNLILSLVLFRNYMEYKRYKGFQLLRPEK